MVPADEADRRLPLVLSIITPVELAAVAEKEAIEVLAKPLRSRVEVGIVVYSPILPVPFGMIAKLLLDAVVICARPVPEKAIFAPLPERVKALPVLVIVSD